MNKENIKFKNYIAKLVVNKIKTKSEIEKEYGICQLLIDGWERKYLEEIEENNNKIPNEKLEIFKLKKELKEKEKEIKILKEATHVLSKQLKH